MSTRAERKNHARELENSNGCYLLRYILNIQIKFTTLLRFRIGEELETQVQSNKLLRFLSRHLLSDDVTLRSAQIPEASRKARSRATESPSSSLSKSQSLSLLSHLQRERRFHAADPRVRRVKALSADVRRCIAGDVPRVVRTSESILSRLYVERPRGARYVTQSPTTRWRLEPVMYYIIR